MKYFFTTIAFSLMLTACGGTTVQPPEDDDPSDFLPRSDVRGLDQLYPYIQDGSYADVLAGCMTIENRNDACTLETLPFLVQELGRNPTTIEDIMSRVVVTHDWMGERFEQYLRDSSPLIVDLFSFVTSVRIGSTVRPSNYSTRTGAISLDPIYLWQTLEEKQTIDVAPDFRADNGNGFMFTEFRSWRRDGERFVPSFDLEDRNARSYDDLKFNLDRLMHHELAHAFDYLPGSIAAADLDSTLQPFYALDGIYGYRRSNRLANDLPLTSDFLRDMARVLYFDDVEPTAEQLATDAYFVGSEFAMDGAIKPYSYSTTREAFANLFEAVMMKTLYDADQYVAIVTQPEDIPNSTCDDYIVTWGSRNRMGDPLVAPRAKYAMNLVLVPRLYQPVEDVIESTELRPNDMTVGVDWCTNLAPQTATDGIQSRNKVSTEERRAAEHRMLLEEMRQMRLQTNH